MIETVSGAIYSLIGITGLFGILILICKDVWHTHNQHSTLDNIGMLFVCLAILELEVMLIVEIAIYYMKYN